MYRKSIFFIILLFSISGCSTLQKVKASMPSLKTNASSSKATQTVQADQTAPKSQSRSGNQKLGKVHIVKSAEKIPAGPVTVSNTSFGGIHLGWSYHQIIKQFGQPSKTGVIRATPFVTYDYEKEHVGFAFYRKGETSKIGGVININISKGTDLQMNNGLGIGSAFQDIRKHYQNIYATEDHSNVWIQGEYSYTIGSGKNASIQYYPTLWFRLKKGIINSIILSSNEYPIPSPSSN